MLQASISIELYFQATSDQTFCLVISTTFNLDTGNDEWASKVVYNPVILRQIVIHFLQHLYSFDETDIGPEVHNCSTYSASFIKAHVRVVNQSLYLHGYLDTENSVNRLYDLAQYVCEHRAFDTQLARRLVGGGSYPVLLRGRMSDPLS